MKKIFSLSLVFTLTFSLSISVFAEPLDWSEDIRLTDASDASIIPSIAIDSEDNIHITWADHRDGNYEIYYTKLNNQGNTLVDDVRRTFDEASSLNPSIAIDLEDDVHIVWQDHRDTNDEIYYMKLDNNGNTLVDDSSLTESIIFGDDSQRPSIAVDSQDNIHIAYRDFDFPGNFEISYIKLDNNGNILNEEPITLSLGHSLDPSLAVDSEDNVHIAWHDRRDFNYEIYYTKLDNNGDTLVQDRRLTFNSPDSFFPSLALDSEDNVHIAWQDNVDNDDEIYYTKLDNDGDTLVNDLRLTFAPGHSFTPSLAIDPQNNISIVWQDERDVNSEIYFTKLDNNGDTIEDDLRLTEDDAASTFASIAIDSQNSRHVVWQDNRDKNDEIYYKRSLTTECPWDLDGNGEVGITDFLDLLLNWGNPYDINDFLALLDSWGPCGALQAQPPSDREEKDIQEILQEHLSEEEYSQIIRENKEELEILLRN